MTTPVSAAEPTRVPSPRVSTDVVVATPGWRPSLLAALIVWAAARVAYAILTVLSRQLAPGGGSFLFSWLQWDGWHYYRIAEGGYDTAPQSIAFFPLFPILFKAVDAVLPGGLLVAAMVLANLCTYGALVLLHRLAVVEFDRATADRTIYVLAVFPTAYFLAAPYNHSLFLLLSIGCLYAARQRSWWLAGGLGALASATRSVGVLLVLPVAFEYLRRREFAWRRVRLDATAIALIPTGLAAFAAYCWYHLGDPFAFSTAQTFWAKEFGWPGQTMWSAIAQLGSRSLVENYHLVGDLAGTLLGLALLVACFVGPWALRRDQWYLVVWAAPVVALPLFFPLAQENPLSGMARYLLDVAVLFLVLARALAHRAVERSYVLIALALQFGYLLMYLRGEWTF